MIFNPLDLFISLNCIQFFFLKDLLLLKKIVSIFMISIVESEINSFFTYEIDEVNKKRQIKWKKSP